MAKLLELQRPKINNLLRGNQEEIFNDLLDLRADIVKEEKLGTRYDFIGTLQEGVGMDMNEANKGVTLDLQEK